MGGAVFPQTNKGGWREGLTAEDMKKCRWLKLKPQLVGRDQVPRMDARC